MSEQLSTLLIVTLAVLALIFLWVCSIAATFWDVSRRKLPAGQTAAWMALVVLVPGIGFGAYLFSRLLGLFFSEGREPAAVPGGRVTLLKREPELQPQPRPQHSTGTIAAVELVQQTIAEVPAVHDASPAQYVLSVVEGPHTGRGYDLKRLPVCIGRGSEAAVRLDQDLGVSRQHAEIYAQAGGLRIRDLKSTHGTLVNGLTIQDGDLSPGDRVQVGLSLLVLGIKEEIG